MNSPDPAPANIAEGHGRDHDDTARRVGDRDVVGGGMEDGPIALLAPVCSACAVRSRSAISRARSSFVRRSASLAAESCEVRAAIGFFQKPVAVHQLFERIDFTLPHQVIRNGDAAVADLPVCGFLAEDQDEPGRLPRQDVILDGQMNDEEPGRHRNRLGE